MDERISPGGYFQYSPSPHSSPYHSVRPASGSGDVERYLAELWAERQKLAPFVQVFPFCNKLLSQEIIKVSGLAHNQYFVSSERIEHGSPMRLSGQPSNGELMDVEGWAGIQTEENSHFQRTGFFQGSQAAWSGSPGVVATPVVKRVVRLDVPVDKFPNFNFVGRLLGPRGNSLKRVEASTHCRVYIRGRGSVKDSVKMLKDSEMGRCVWESAEIAASITLICTLSKMIISCSQDEEKLRDKPGYEHLNEPLHVLVEAEFPADHVDKHLNQAVAILEDLLKPVEESHDYYKKQQLRELAMLNGTLREESPSPSPSPQMSPSISPFNSTGLKRAKTGR